MPYRAWCLASRWDRMPLSHGAIGIQQFEHMKQMQATLTRLFGPIMTTTKNENCWLARRKLWPDLASSMAQSSFWLCTVWTEAYLAYG
mmetsp:Transcript_68703/g.154431  ORF Transcript_68703/g.154431 Transcript_68703/m.154431 type:complete len:88 (+) Transcript_68703:419-682(+)